MPSFPAHPFFCLSLNSLAMSWDVACLIHSSLSPPHSCMIFLVPCLLLLGAYRLNYFILGRQLDCCDLQGHGERDGSWTRDAENSINEIGGGRWKGGDWGPAGNSATAHPSFFCWCMLPSSGNAQYSTLKKNQLLWAFYQLFLQTWNAHRLYADFKMYIIDEYFIDYKIIEGRVKLWIFNWGFLMLHAATWAAI